MIARWLVPGPLRAALRRLRDRARGRRLWESLRFEGLPADEVRLFYGHPEIPGLDSQTRGGIVKFQHMQRAYPNSPSRFNVLYLVSSNRPPGAPELARLAKRRGVRIAVNQDGVAYPAWAGPGWRDANGPMAELIVLADHVFYQSAFCQTSAERFLGVRAESSEVLHNPVDTKLFFPRPAARDSLRLLLGGTQYQRYRIDLAFATLAVVRKERADARLEVTGRLTWRRSEAVARADAEAMAERHGVRDSVTFSGPYSQRDAPGVFARADILLHTKYNDPCPGVVLEAMACGVPVVYSDSGGTPELVGEAGRGVATELSWERDILPSPAALAAAVIEVASDLRGYAAVARERAVSRFDLERWLARHRDVFGALA